MDTMEEGFNRRDVLLSFQKFRDYASDVLSSDRVTFPTRFDIFLDHCETDRVMKVIRNQLMAIDVDAIKWWYDAYQTKGSYVGSMTFSLPTNEDERDALLFRICLLIHDDKIDLVTFSNGFFRVESYNEMVSRFNEVIFKPMVRSLGYKIGGIIESLETMDKDSLVPVKSLIIFQSITNVNGDIKAKGDVVIGEGGVIDKRP